MVLKEFQLAEVMVDRQVGFVEVDHRGDLMVLKEFQLGEGIVDHREGFVEVDHQVEQMVLEGFDYHMDYRQVGVLGLPRVPP
jgi:hypothetical protein